MTYPQYGQSPVHPIPRPGAPVLGQPPLPVPPRAGQPILVVIGDIGVTADHVITPSGTFPLADITIYGMDQTQVIRKTPTWAIVLAILGFLFLFLGLLFLLVKEESLSGYVMVTVEAQGRRHASMVPVASVMARTDIMQRIGYVQTLSANARSRTYR